MIGKERGIELQNSPIRKIDTRCFGLLPNHNYYQNPNYNLVEKVCLKCGHYLYDDFLFFWDEYYAVDPQKVVEKWKKEYNKRR